MTRNADEPGILSDIPADYLREAQGNRQFFEKFKKDGGENY
jgi:hypothetical protein